MTLMKSLSVGFTKISDWKLFLGFFFLVFFLLQGNWIMGVWFGLVWFGLGLSLDKKGLVFGVTQTQHRLKQKAT